MVNSTQASWQVVWPRQGLSRDDHLKNLLMQHSSKSINEYWDKYEEIYSFEEILKFYREQVMLDFLNEQKPSSILEIGCGFTPVCKTYNDFDTYTAVEPGERPYEMLAEYSKKDLRITCINSFFEAAANLTSQNKFDCIVSTGVLHETETPRAFLRKLRTLMTDRTFVYINVPNSNSIHRILASEMGIIASVNEKSKRNTVLGQSSIFNTDSLKQLLLDEIPDAKIIDCKTFFIKPFTHDQMMKCLENKILDRSVMDGLQKCSKIFPNNGCEIYITFSLRD